MLASPKTEHYLEVTVVLCWAGLVTTIQVDTAAQLLIAAFRDGHELTTIHVMHV